MAIVGFHIDVRKGCITFEVKGRYVVFCQMKEKVVSPNSSTLDEFPPSPEIDKILLTFIGFLMRAPTKGM